VLAFFLDRLKINKIVVKKYFMSKDGQEVKSILIFLNHK